MNLGGIVWSWMYLGTHLREIIRGLVTGEIPIKRMTCLFIRISVVHWLRVWALIKTICIICSVTPILAPCVMSVSSTCNRRRIHGLVIV